MAYKYTVIIEKDEDGFFIASCPVFPGCFTQGKTYKEVIENIEDLIQTFIQMKKEKNEPLPQEVGVRKVKVG